MAHWIFTRVKVKRELTAIIHLNAAFNTLFRVSVWGCMDCNPPVSGISKESNCDQGRLFKRRDSSSDQSPDFRPGKAEYSPLWLWYVPGEGQIQGTLLSMFMPCLMSLRIGIQILSYFLLYWLATVFNAFNWYQQGAIQLSRASKVRLS